MRHIWYLAKAVMLVTVLFAVVNHLAFQMLKAVVIDSRFRAVVAANASNFIDQGQRVTLFIGNSRIMGSVDPRAVIPEGEGRLAYNLAYNGLYLDDLRLMLDAFIQSCDCDVGSIYANVGIFLREQRDPQSISELQRFMSAIDPNAMQAVQQKDAVYATMMRLFPLLHFNNEFFLRALYYRATGRDDQAHASDFTFAITAEVEDRLAAMTLESGLDSETLEKFRLDLEGLDIRLVVIQPPYHKVYIDNVPGYSGNQSDMEDALVGAGVRYLDHSGLFYERPELFADPFHLNRAGQQQYSKYLLGIVQAGGDK